MMRVDTEWWEVVSADGGGHTRFASKAEAIANRGGGQVRRRVATQDVRAAYQVRLDGAVIDTKMRAVEAAAVSKQHPGATVHMVPAG